MSDEEYDYMSDCFTTGSTDVRPGIVKSHTQKRALEIAEKQKNLNEMKKLSNKRLKVVEAERRDIGLNEAISSENKGFALLQKMGYTMGQSLGKSGSGIKEPILINVKSNRAGLGREAAMKVVERKAQIRAKARVDHLDNDTLSDFRSRQSKIAAASADGYDLAKCMRACRDLDKANDVNKPLEKWFWPAEIVEKKEKESDNGDTDILSASDKSDEEDEEDDDGADFAPGEKLSIISNYLREAYFYCVWCGAAYDDDKDLSDNCPGPTRDDH